MKMTSQKTYLKSNKCCLLFVSLLGAFLGQFRFFPGQKLKEMLIKAAFTTHCCKHMRSTMQKKRKKGGQGQFPDPQKKVGRWGRAFPRRRENSLLAPRTSVFIRFQRICGVWPLLRGGFLAEPCKASLHDSLRGFMTKGMKVRPDTLLGMKQTAADLGAPPMPPTPHFRQK